MSLKPSLISRHNDRIFGQGRLCDIQSEVKRREGELQ